MIVQYCAIHFNFPICPFKLFVNDIKYRPMFVRAGNIAVKIIEQEWQELRKKVSF